MAVVLIPPQVLYGLSGLWTNTQKIDSGVPLQLQCTGSEIALQFFGGVGQNFGYWMSGVYYPNSGGAQVGWGPSQSSPSVVSGTVYNNSTGRNLTIYLPVYATTSGTAGTLAFALGATSSPATIWTRFVNGSTSSTATDPVTLRIPPGFYWSVTTSGTTLGTATQIEE